MKILHVIPDISAKAGGTTYAVINILMIENNIGIKSTVLSARIDETDKKLLELANLISFSPSFPKRFLRSKSANRWLKKNAPIFNLAVIHTIWNALSMEASAILGRLRVPFVIWPHGSLDPFDLKKKRLAKKLLGPLLIRPMLNKSYTILCTSWLEAEKLERYGAKTEVSVLPLPVMSYSGAGDRKRFRQKFSIKNDEFVILFLSRIDYKKGLNLLIPALKKVSEKFSNIKLMIAGTDSNDYEKNVRSWIHKYSLENKVIMPGFLTGQDKDDAFSGSDCFVLPSMNENFGIAVVEALSAGLPVLISDNVYIWKEIIQNGGGWVCKYSIESLVESITAILKNPIDFKNKRAKAEQSAQNFSLKKTEDLYKKFYRELKNER